MKLLEIRLKNINSLRGEHHIRFDRSPLREAGLFGIVGSMGSGKSTLLDCITLALYGKVQRFDKLKQAIEKGGSILTKHEKECFAEVKYACSKGVFTSRWLLAKTRNNTYRPAEMQVFDETGQQLSEQLSSAPAVNMANIGLDYDQFIKSILLCQGEFAKFLKSDKNERAQLLEKITGISAFRTIGIRAFRSFNTRKKKIDAATEAMKIAANRLMTDEQRNSLAQAVAASAQKAGSMQQELDQARIGLEQLKRILQLKKDIAQRKKIMEQDQLLLNHFNGQHGEALDHYDRLYAHRETMQGYGRMLLSIQEHKQKIGQLEQELSAQEAKI